MKKTNKKSQKKTMKKSTVIIIVVVVVVAAVLAGFGIKALVSRNGGGNIEKVDISQVQDSVQDMIESDGSASDAVLATDTEENEDASEEADLSSGENAKDVVVVVESAEGLIGFTEGLFIDNNGNGNSGGTVSGGTTTHADIPTISFPYVIESANIVVEQISPYSGYFIEDGSDESVSNIAAIVVTNNGGDLDFVGIGISQDDRNLAFSASQIPAGATVIIQEQSRASYTNGNYYSCTATTTESEGFSNATDTITVSDNGNNSFDVTNIGEETISEVKVYFKSYLPEEDVYVGGITYSATLTDIEPQTAVTVDSSHYDSQYSTIIEVVTGE